MEVFMRLHSKQFTEPIFSRLADYRDQLTEHPLLVASRTGRLTRHTLEQFAFHQYSDSILWIPMLAQMKSAARRSRRLRQAIEDNIAHEAGLAATSHVALAVDMMRSLGMRSLEGMPIETFARSATLWLSDAFADQTEPEVAGFLLTAETLVPLMFAALEPSFTAIGCDTSYFREHISVDSEEHSTWMADAVSDIVTIYGESCVEQIVDGMVDAWQETREVPDTLWRMQCESH
jgi:pyrroloquinoline quinone (PQQ) biosynthesis protein C